MARIHLSVELLDRIISEFVNAHPQNYNDTRWSTNAVLVPLLLVEKAWYPIVEKHLYQSIKINDGVLGLFIQDPESCGTINTPSLGLGEANGTGTLETRSRKRFGYEVAEDLLRTLREFPRLASLVRSLSIVFPIGLYVSEASNAASTQTGIDIIRLCANIENVVFHEYYDEKVVALFEALEDKSLISFDSRHRVRPYSSSSTPWDLGVLFFKAMGRWPRLRTVSLPSLPYQCSPGRSHCIPSDFVPTSMCLHLEVLFTKTIHGNDLRALRIMCPNLKRLNVRIEGDSDADGIHALSECLRAWAPSLQTFYCDVQHGLLNPQNSSILQNSFRTLSSLEEFTSYKENWDVSSLSDLPCLRRLVFLGENKESFVKVAECLEDMQKFPSLRFIDVHYPRESESWQRLETRCHSRQIRLTKL